VLLDRYRDAATGGRTADRIAAAQLALAYLCAEGDVLTRKVRVVVLQLLGHVERDLDRVRGQRPDLGDLELVEPRAAAGLHRHSEHLEEVERLEARTALVQRLAAGRAEARDLHGVERVAARALHGHAQRGPPVAGVGVRWCDAELAQLGL